MPLVITQSPFNAIADCLTALTEVTLSVGAFTLTTTQNYFSSGDVGKIFYAIRQDVPGGLSPWWQTNQGNVTITQVLAPNTINLSVIGSNAPPAGAYVPQSWPYLNTLSQIFWGTDNSPAIQAAILSGVGDSVFVPTGTFATSTTVYFPSNTTLRGYSATGSVLLPMSVNSPGWFGTGTSGNTNIVPAFCNEAYKNYFGTNSPITDVDAAIAASGDTNISVNSLVIDMRATAILGGVSWRNFLVSGLTMSNTTISGNAYTGPEGPNCIGCAGVNLSSNFYLNAGYAFNPWTGPHDITFSNNYVDVLYNAVSTGGITSFPGPYLGCVLNVVGLTPTNDLHTYNIEISNNKFYLHGADYTNYPTIGIGIVPDGMDCPVSNVGIFNNTIYCSGFYNGAFVFNGNLLGVKVYNNTVIGCNAEGNYISSVLSMQGSSETQAGSSAIVNVSSISGSSTVSIDWPGNGYAGTNLDVLASYFQVGGGPTVGGISLNGIYPITSVLSASGFNFFVSGQTASATTSAAWNGAFATITQLPQSCQIFNNLLINCTSPSNPLITVNGINNALKDNTATYTNNATVSHLCFVSWGAVVGAYPAGAVIGNAGVPGTGVPAGYLGNGLVAYANYTATPVIQNNVTGA